MISRNLYSQIVLRVLIILLLALTAGSVVALNGPVIIALVCIIVEIPVVINLINYLNTANRKISYFLESVKNNDSALLLPTNNKNKYLRELFRGLDKINEQIKQLKIENLQREQYFQILLEHIPTGIVTYNAKGFVYHANSAAKKMLSMEVITHIKQFERINHDLYNIVVNIKPFEQKMVSLTNQGVMIELSLKAASFKTINDELILLSIQDIRNELNEKELDSWMKLIRVLMHEIMNTIAPITSLSESLHKFLTIDGRPALPEEVDNNIIQKTLQGLNVIKEQAGGLMLFVESYRKLMHLPKPDKKSFKVEDLINRIKILYHSLENSENVELIVKVDPLDMDLFADQNLISQVLLNLLKNALEAIDTRPGGRIRLIAGYTLNHHPEICVADNGPGIPPEFLEQIFMPFFTTHSNGSGIGLSLSRQVMRLHGGTLQVRSIPDKETIFTMIF
jgi:two-component system, NtrC family, nitrogen regulation sensor histidine kinase NtrY